MLAFCTGTGAGVSLTRGQAEFCEPKDFLPQNLLQVTDVAAAFDHGMINGIQRAAVGGLAGGGCGYLLASKYFDTHASLPRIFRCVDAAVIRDRIEFRSPCKESRAGRLAFLCLGAGVGAGTAIEGAHTCPSMHVCQCRCVTIPMFSHCGTPNLCTHCAPPRRDKDRSGG
eukprot:SAG31_NODE_314_length_17854_cov_3.932075_8_plen_170_part_00